MPYSEEQLAELKAKDREARAKGKPGVDMSQVPVTEKRQGGTRPAPVSYEPIPVGFVMALKDAPFPIKYYESIRANATEACCKELDNLTAQKFKSNPSLEEADSVVITCKVCGRKHRR